MANILDYLDWRGDLSFEASPFNEVDNYIVSKIGCFDFTGIVAASFEEISIGEAVGRYCGKYGSAGDYTGLLASKYISPVVKRLPQTVRFRDLKLSGFVNRVDRAADKQFSALTVTMPGGLRYVSFRGTDDTLLAWKENLMMGIEREIPAQKDAIDYLNRAASACPGPLIAGGHSKGGNLAVFAAANVRQDLQERIVRVYSNDGPGFYPEFLREAGYLRIRDRVVTIVPQNSVVGTLLTQDDNLQVVECDKIGGVSHDGFTWEVKGPSFVHCPSLSAASRAFDAGLSEVFDPMPAEERRVFIEQIFNAFEATGVTTLTELTEHKLRQARSLLKSFKNAPEAKRFFSMVLGETVKDYVPKSSAAHAINVIKGSGGRVIRDVKTGSAAAVEKGRAAVSAKAKAARKMAWEKRSRSSEDTEISDFGGSAIANGSASPERPGKFRKS